MDQLISDFLQQSHIIVPIAVLLVSLYTVGKGADILVDNAVSLSLHWGVPKMVLGATLVSLGTTLPEASVSVLAAVKGNPDLALGNAIGSIIVDTGLIIGVASLLGSLPVNKTLIKRQGTLQFSAAILLSFISLPFFSPGREGKIYQWMGWGLTALLCLYMYVSFKWAKDAAGTAESTASAEDEKPLIIQFLLLFAGIAVVIISSKLLIPSVAIVAAGVGIPQSVIAATLVAFGTSVPELVTAITSVRKGHGELAVGNIIGADILNVLFVLGAAAAVTPAGIRVPVYFFYLQIPAMLAVLIIFRFCSTRKIGKITKLGGGLLLAFYLVYLCLNFLIRGVQ